MVYSGKYDGDMVIGMGFTQPDKAGSFGLELVKLFKMMSNEHYAHTEEDIDRTLEVTREVLQSI